MDVDINGCKVSDYFPISNPIVNFNAYFCTENMMKLKSNMT